MNTDNKNTAPPVVPLESREIRGLTVKTLFWLFSLIGTNLCTGVGIYYKLTTTQDAQAKEMLELTRTVVQYQAATNKRLDVHDDFDQHIDMDLFGLRTELRTKGIIALEPEPTRTKPGH